MRLIDADALKMRIEEETKITDLIGGEIAALSRSMQECINEELDRAPAIDAEPVIRCENCRNCIPHGDGEYHCRIHGGWVELDDYCSWAESWGDTID